MKRLLVPSAALLWGLQIAFLSPALALILVTLYDASTAQVGWILTVYNASGFVASLLVPSYADRREDYLRPMLACGVLTLVLALVLAFTTSLLVAVVALVVVGGPAGVGSSMLYAHLRHSGAKPADIVNTRAIVSVAWIAGRLSLRFSGLRLIVTGCVAGIAYYVAMAYVSGPVMLLALQPLNAWCFAAIAGVGLTLFQQMISRPGLSTGLYANTRRVGAIVSGPIIALGSTTALGNRGIFLACGLLIVLALAVIATAARQRERRPTADLAH